MHGRLHYSLALVVASATVAHAFVVVTPTPPPRISNGQRTLERRRGCDGVVLFERRNLESLAAVEEKKDEKVSWTESWWQENWGRVAILSCAMVYGTNFAMVKTLDSSLAPSLSASLRFGLAAFASLPFLLKSKSFRQSRELFAGAAEVGVVIAMGYISQAVGLESVDASLSAFVCSLVVVVVPALDAIILKRKTPLGTWAGCCLAAVGVALLSLGGGAEDQAAGLPVTPVAAICTGLQPIFFGYGFWRTEQLLRREDDDGAGSIDTSLSCAAAQLAAVKAAADIWLVADFCEGHLPNTPDILAQVNQPSVILAVFWTGLVTTFATVFVETVALAKISAKETSLLFTTEPLWGSAFAAVTLHEHLGATAALGGVLVVASCVLTVLVNNQPDDILAIDFTDVVGPSDLL